MKKKIFSILLIFVLIFSLAACGGGGSSTTTPEQETYLIRLASDETIDTPCSKAVLIFKELMETKSEGRVTVEYFNDSALGDEREIAESLNMGNIEMGIISGALLATYAPDWYLLDLPYVFLDRETMYSHLDGEVGTHLRDVLLANSKIEVLDYADGSFKILLNSVKPVTNVADLKNLKFRCQESKINMALYKSWNSTAIPMGFSEIYTALQQGAIDGVDTSPLYQRSGGFFEVGKYFSLTNHQALSMISIINTDYLASLPEDIQTLIKESSKEAFAVEERRIVEAAELEAAQIMRDAGCEEYVLTDAERNTFVEASKAVIEEYRSVIDPKLYDLLGL